MKLFTKLFLGVLVMAVLLGSAWAIVCASSIFDGQNMRIVSFDEKQITPFEFITAATYDLGDGWTVEETSSTVTIITSVKHTDKRRFTAEQWEEILDGIANGNIVWED